MGFWKFLMSFLKIILDKHSFDVNQALMNISANPVKFTLDHMILYHANPFLLQVIHLYVDAFLRTTIKTNIQCKFALCLYECLTVDKYYNDENSKQNFNITMCQMISLTLKTNKKKN